MLLQVDFHATMKGSLKAVLMWNFNIYMYYVCRSIVVDWLNCAKTIFLLVHYTLCSESAKTWCDPFKAMNLKAPSDAEIVLHKIIATIDEKKKESSAVI